MNAKIFTDNEIFPLPYNGGYLVYAPLSSLFFYLSQEQLDRVESALSGTSNDSDAIHLIDYIRSERKSSRTIPKKISVNQIHKLTILPTYNCNFHCTYCYSAGGRQRKNLSLSKAQSMIDYFIDRKRTELNDLWLAVLGGGEPFLAPDLTCDIIEHAYDRARDQKFNLGIGLTTNGSVYHAALSDVMKKCRVNLGVSFEVLRDIQELQRRNFDQVVDTVRQYMYDGVDITIKSIITPDNVNRLCEMVDELHKLFPLVKKYKLQIVEDTTMFRDRETMKRFYNSFTQHFFEAQKLGREWDVNVYVLASQYVDVLIEHYCGGEMCLNPEGTITICHRYSSPLESGYQSIVYGSVHDDGSVSLDDAKFRSLIAHDIDANPKCNNCFAKWHCGGGCLAQASLYEQDQLDIICQWTRDFTFQLLQRRFEQTKHLSK